MEAVRTWEAGRAIVREMTDVWHLAPKLSALIISALI